MIAFVFSVTRARTSSGSRFIVCASISAKTGSRAAAGDRLCGRVERERRADHLVAGPDPERVERDHERVRAVRDADRVLDSEVRGGLFLEGLDVRAEDEPARVENVGDSLLQLVQQRRVLRLDVNQRDLRHGGPV